MGNASSTDLYLTIAIISGLALILIAFLIDIGIQVYRRTKRERAIATGEIVDSTELEDDDGAGSEANGTDDSEPTIFNKKSSDQPDETVTSNIEMARIAAARRTTDLSMAEKTRRLLGTK
jgi:hypothetical protein